MKIQRLLSLTRQAVDRYHMLEPNDHIALGLSGGKDSLTLLYVLHQLQQFYPNPFQLSAITVDLGFDGFDLSPVKKICQELSVPHTTIETQIKKIIFDTRKETNPCALCAKLRKGVFNAKAKELGCNKIAYAHHKDDLIETMLLSLLYEGRFHAYAPCTYLDRTGLSVIRPLMQVDEADIIRFQQNHSLPVCKNPCPVDGFTKREYVKKLTKTLEQENPGSRNQMYHAILEGNLPNWKSMT